MTIEDRMTALETSVKAEFAAIGTRLEAVFADEQSWCERYWDYVALAAFLAGVVLGLVA